jgi:DNA-binding LytR/AlgR family response regulator
MRTPSALIAEDEPLLRAQLRELLGTLWPELDIRGEAEDGTEAIRAIDALVPDVVFLDIEMPGASGLDVALHASGRCHVAFVTAYDKYAVAAFEQGAVDYVMKPFSRDRLETTVARLKARLGAAPANLDALVDLLAGRVRGARPYLRWVAVSEGDEVQLITVEEICYFQADTKYTLAATAGTQSLIRKPLKELLVELDPNLFWRIHRSTLVNVNAIAGVTRDLKGNLRVRLKQRRETLAVSESYAHRFRQL